MKKVIERSMIVPNMHLLVIEAPEIASKVKPGQFVIVRGGDEGERIPLSIADYDAEKGTISIVFMEVGASTAALARLEAGDAVATCVGPLGNATTIDTFGNVMLVGGCYGIGSLYPVARELKAKGNKVSVVLEARSSYLIYWLNKYVPLVEKVYTITRDGSLGQKGHISRLPDVIHSMPRKPDRIIVNGCTYLMAHTSEVTKDLDIPVVVNLNPIMIDGTGMCGVCRVTVAGQMKFACVDGPEFDGHDIDWKEFLARRKAYVTEEAIFFRRSDAPAHNEGKCVWHE
ncbi:MAG: Dihydroorotate dehydrogenase B (NAD(+)), electron transfer subunit [Syntrophorhabdus sp. PtaB.Bin047]|nr:MAG: Dihydroorotate dehydrogenase B (NAD(+)), electron transfer subunit [Syntrophorhabdus sp. PtaB.Bin047]